MVGGFSTVLHIAGFLNASKSSSGTKNGISDTKPTPMPPDIARVLLICHPIDESTFNQKRSTEYLSHLPGHRSPRTVSSTRYTTTYMPPKSRSDGRIGGVARQKGSQHLLGLTLLSGDHTHVGIHINFMRTGRSFMLKRQQHHTACILWISRTLHIVDNWHAV